MLEHARAMGFVVRRQSHGEVKPPAKKAAAKKLVAKKSLAKKVASKKALAKQPAVKKAAAKTAPQRPVSPGPVAKKATAAKKAVPAKTPAAKPCAAAKVKVGMAANAASVGAPPTVVAPAPSTRSATISADELRKITENLRKMGGKRPAKGGFPAPSVEVVPGGGAWRSFDRGGSGGLDHGRRSGTRRPERGELPQAGQRFVS
jgi:hypothetical protein